MEKTYRFNKVWLDLLLENKDNMNLSFKLSENDTRILLSYIEVLRNKIDKFTEIIENLYSEKEICKHQYKEYMSILKESGE